MTNTPYPRDLIGYADNPPRANWPDGNRLALQFVLNYEEGSELNILHGDTESETFLAEIINVDKRQNVRHMSMESMYEYGSRVGVWRILQLFKDFEIPLTIFAVGMAVERHPQVIEQMTKLDHEICSHGYRWIDYQYIPENIERDHLHRAIEAIKSVTGERPYGWYTGRTGPNTRRLVAEDGGFLYDADDYSDDLPFWDNKFSRPHLIIPYTLDNNDMRFATPQGFNSGEQFLHYLKDAFDTLYEESASIPRMMSVGLHCRLIGRPGRFQALKHFVEYVRNFDDVWFCRRIEIARHWHKYHPVNP